MDLIEHVKQNVNYTEYYKEFYPNWSGDYNENVICSFHAEKTGSFSLNVKDTGGCYCHGCKIKIGSIIHFEKEKSTSKLSDHEAARIIYDRHIKKILAWKEEDINDKLNPLIEHLLNNNKILDLLKKDLHLTDDTINQFQLGWRPDKFRITIPIFDAFNHLVNVRYYQLPSLRKPDNKYPKIYNEKDYGKPACLFPLNLIESVFSTRFKPAKLYFFAGERDTILAWSLGIPSLTATTGEKVWRDEWIKYLLSLQIPIIIVGDTDEVGREAAEFKLEELRKAGIASAKVDLPPDYKDFSKWVIEGGGTADKLREITPEVSFEPIPDSNGDIPFPKIFDPTSVVIEEEQSVADIGRSPELLNKTIKIKAVVSGKLDRTYSIPYKFQIGKAIYQLPPCRELVQMIRMSDDGIIKYVKNMVSARGTITPIEYVTVTEVEIIPMIIPGVDSLFVVQRCIFIGDVIETNLPYMMAVVPTSDMNTQETIGLIIEILPVSSVLDDIKFDTKTRVKLAAKFKPRHETDPFIALQKQMEELAIRHTLICNRQDWHMVSWLTWMCPLEFEFYREGKKRGWLNTLGLGDTETGKSEVAKKIRELLNCGVFINAENCTYVGLVGGAVKGSGGGFMLRWGKIPLYNRQIVIIEELSGLSIEQISHMSDVRSSGIARLDKGGLSGETSARTRLLCLSNVRNRHGSLETASSGVEALIELIGQKEDISRFDIITTLTDSEVSAEAINAPRHESDKKNQPFSPVEIELFRLLVTFIWSLKPNQINITVPAYLACLKGTLELCKDYHSSIPLFKAGSGRLKIARLACAISCAQFNWNEHTQQMDVEPRHVEAAIKLLRTLYDKPSLGYRKYSVTKFRLEYIHEKDKMNKVIKDTFKDDSLPFVKFLLQVPYFTSKDLAEGTGKPNFLCDRVIATMFSSNALQKAKYSGWELTKPGRNWLEQKQVELLNQ